MEITSDGGRRYEDQEGWQTLMHAQRTCLPEVLWLSYNGVKGELLGGHAAAAISIYVGCHCSCCHDRLSQLVSDGFNYSKGIRSGQANTGGANSSRGKAPSGGGSRSKIPVQHLPGPLFHLEDWFVHCNSKDPSWQPPNDLRFPQKADKLIKRSIQVVQAAGNGVKSGSGGEHMVALGDWMVDFCRRYHGRGNSLVNMVVQILWWNDIAGSDPGVSGYPFPYGNWYRGTVVSVSPKTGHLKVRFTDGEENEVAMGVNFVHFGNEHPTGDQHARLPSPLPPRLLSPQSAAVGRLAGRLEFTVSKASGSGCNSGYDRGRPSGRGSGSGNDDNILGESGQGNSNVSGCNTPGSVLTSLRTLASQDGGNCKEQDPPSAKAGKARGKGPALRKGGGVSCTPRSEGCGTGMHGKAASVVSPQTTILTVSTTATVLSDGDAPPTKRPKVVAVGPPQLALSGSKCGEDGAGSDREAPTGGLNTGPPACAVAAGPTGLMTTKTDVGNNTNHATIIQSDYLPVPGLEKVSTRPPSGTTSAPVLSPRGRLQPSKRASVLGSQEHQQLQEQAALPPSPSPSPVVSTDVIDDSANAQSPKTRAAKRRRLKDAHCGTPVSEHAIGSHCGPRVGSRNTDSSAFTSMAKSQQDSEIQNAPNRTAQVEKVMDTVSTGALVKGTNTTTAGAVAGEVVVSSGQSSPGGCSQQVQWVPVSHGAAQAAEPSSLPLAECLPGCGPPSGLQSGQGAESAHDSTLRPEGLGPRDVTKGCEVGGMSAGGGGGSIRVTGSDIHGMGGKGSVGDDDACGDDAGGSGNAQDGAADARGSCKRKAVGHGRVHSCNGAAMRSNNGPESTLRVVEMADLGATVAETAAAPTVGKCTTIPGDFMDATATGPADTTTNAWTMDTVVVATGVDVETVVGLVHMGLEAESRDPAPHHTPGADVAFDCARGALMPVSVAAGDGSTVVDREQMEHRGGDKEYVTALERRSREPSSRSCGEEAGLKMAREGDISGTADVSPGNIPGIEAQAAPLPPAAGEEAAATATVASIAVPETQGGLNSAEHPGTAAETLTVPVHERQQHLHESQQLGMEWERTYAGGEQFQSQLDTLPLPGGSEIALPPAPEPGPQRVPMELERHEPQPQSLSPCIPGIISAQRSLDPGLTEEPAAAAVDLSQEGAAGKTTVLSTGAHNPVEAPLVHHAIVAPLPAQHSKPLLPREVDGAVAVPRPGSCALTTSNPVPRHDELVAVGSISWQGGLGRCDSRGFRAGLHGEANARPIPGNPSVNNGASVPGGTNKDGGDYLSSGDLSAGGHACQGFRRHGSSSDGGGASASDYILAPPEAAPPPGLSATVTSEWLAWWYVANSTGYGRQAADVLAIARQQLTNVQANFRATIEDCCRQLGCLPLHLRVLQVHYVQQAYMSLKRVPPEAGAKLANQLLLLIKLFLCETARETQQYAETAGLSAMARAAPSAPQPGALGGISGGISGTVGGATRHGQGTAVADSSFAEATRQRHPGPIQMAQQTHHSHPDLNQTIRGLTLEEFWELMAVCGSHCVQIIMIAIGSERAGQAIPKEVHDRLPSFPDLLRWAASAVPAKPAAAQASALQNPRQCSLLPRFQVTMFRLASRLKMVHEAALQQAPDGCQVNIADAMTAVPRCPLPPRPRQPASQEAHGQRQHQLQPQQPAGQSLRTDGDDAAGAIPSAICPVVKCGPAPLREQQDPSRCHERMQNGLARVVQPWRISSRQLYALLKRAGSRREPSSGSASEYESECDGTSAWVSDPPTCPDTLDAGTGGNPNPQGAQQGLVATSLGLADAGEVTGAGTGPILLSVAPEPASDGAPQSCITAECVGLKDLQLNMVTAVDIGAPAVGKDAIGGPAGGCHRPSSADTANGLAAAPAVQASGLKTSRTLFIGRRLLLKSCRTIVHSSKWGVESFAVATAGNGLGVANQTPQMPDPATISRMDAASLSAIVRTLIIRHIQRPRPREGTSSVAHAAAITSADKSMRSITDQASVGNVPDAHASSGGEECVAGPTGLARCLQEQQQQVSEPEMNPRMRLERVLEVWNALPPQRQRALYLVSCRLGMGPDSLGEWWAMDMVVKALESLADAMKSLKSPAEGAISGLGEVCEGIVAARPDYAPAAAAGSMPDLDTWTSGGAASS